MILRVKWQTEYERDKIMPANLLLDFIAENRYVTEKIYPTMDGLNVITRHVTMAATKEIIPATYSRVIHLNHLKHCKKNSGRMIISVKWVTINPQNGFSPIHHQANQTHHTNPTMH